MKLRICFALLVCMLIVCSPNPGMAQDDPPPGLTIHVVQRGETLFRIGMRYGLTVDEMVTLNGLPNPDSIQVGQRLLVPAQPGSASQTHIIQPGETLRTIAALYGLTIDDLARWNQITNIDAIFAGQTLNVSDPTAQAAAPLPPTTTPVPAADPTLLLSETLVADASPASAVNPADADMPASTGALEYATLIHTVQRGETLFTIAQAYGVTVNALLRGNQLTDADTIYAGQQLAVPGVEAPQRAAAFPAPVTGLEIVPLIFTEGQTGRVRVTTALPAVIEGTFLERPLTLALERVGDVSLYTALIGIPVGTGAGVYPLVLTVAGDDGSLNALEVNVQIVGGGYGREQIRLMEGRDQLLEPAVEDAEFAILQRIMSPFSAERYFEDAMGLPAAAAMSSPFGNTRSYNGGAFERIHAGVDFAGIPGTPILAPAPGRVVLADDLNVRGTATVIDHGWGVYTGYWHQSARYVSIGDFIQTGQVIGAIGSSGRVTGAHLHWELWVNGVPVDPMQWARVNFAS
ncbi:MAG: LysM peptidoglycan-binding domain-containing protein [bacterium]|nr:LysM peptidoglycan-binding domain-containing protein [bacterium]